MTLEEVLVPRSEVVGVLAGATVGEVLELSKGAGFSRYPLYRGTLDAIEGIVWIGDLARAPGSDAPVDPFAKPALLVPLTVHCDDLLDRLRAEGRRLAVVLDEYGGTAGVVSYEDLVEELVGEIVEVDEADPRAHRRLARDTVLLDAQAGVEEASEILGFRIPEGNYETVAGFLLRRFGRIPEPGEKVTFEGAVFEIAEADRWRIRSVIVRLPRGGAEAPGRRA
jgi:CBS domain containing-hemolysin-like protein